MVREAETEDRGGAARYVTFRLGDETYAIDVMQVREVLRVSEVSPVPGAPEHVLGIINLRGNVVTVIDVRTRMGLATRVPDDLSRILVIEGTGQVLGMLVDSVAEVIELAESDIEPPPGVGGDGQSRYLRGVANHGGGLTIVVDLNRLLGQEGGTVA